MNKFMLFISAGLIGLLISSNGIAQSAVDTSSEQPAFSIAYTDRGFILEFEQSEYQFIPSREKMEKVCAATAYQISESVAEKQGRPISPIKNQDIRLNLSRNSWSGNSKCLVRVTAYWKQSLSPF